MIALAIGCTAVRADPTPTPTATKARTPTPSPRPSPTATPTRQAGDGGSGSPAGTSFTLTTGLSQGKLVFVGKGGAIDGQVNPVLRVPVGRPVQVTLVNGDGIQHDFTVPDLNAKTDYVTTVGQSTTVTFTANKESQFVYFCSVPGHRLAGMEGLVIVGEGGQDPGTKAPSVVKPPTDLPGPIGRREPQHVPVALEAIETEGRLADGATYTYWTFGGTVPGPFVRVRAGDTVELKLKNLSSSTTGHSIDLHAVTGPGGGAVATQVAPGEEKSFTFKALNPGLYVYHCATPMVAHHISNGMYGLILVEPEDGLAPVDREFYVMQGEIYTRQPHGTKGHLDTSIDKMLSEDAEYFVMNGAVGALTQEHPLKANVGETVRIFYGVGGPNFTSSFHVIGEIFDRVYNQGSLTSTPLTDVQTTLVPAGGAAMVEFKVEVPGRYILVDHALSRAERGLAGYLIVEGAPNPEVFQGNAEGGGH
ncbi:MAG: nitrite reductase, copper-containing [SAR202 cluster bacterium]|nr:nitrite reductase, copper-containing [SAR202 cluster bacterium]